MKWQDHQPVRDPQAIGAFLCFFVNYQKVVQSGGIFGKRSFKMIIPVEDRSGLGVYLLTRAE
jgi:hypothetical protein